MKVFLVGLPGSGKTTIGKLLAKKLGTPFVDLDEIVEKAEGMPVEKIFEEKKEDYFRSVESAQLKKWCMLNTEFVMATGGGTPCFFDNMDAINTAGISIFLDVPAWEIANRMLKTEILKRPLLARATPDEVRDRIALLHTHRLAFYRKAKATIPHPDISVEQMMKQIAILKSEGKA